MTWISRVVGNENSERIPHYLENLYEFRFLSMKKHRYAHSTTGKIPFKKIGVYQKSYSY